MDNFIFHSITAENTHFRNNIAPNAILSSMSFVGGNLEGNEFENLEANGLRLDPYSGLYRNSFKNSSFKNSKLEGGQSCDNDFSGSSFANTSFNYKTSERDNFSKVSGDPR